MDDARNSIDNRGTRQFEVNVETPEKPVESPRGERTQTAVTAGEQQEAVQRQPDEKLDLWMENIKQFIRNIDVELL